MRPHRQAAPALLRGHGLEIGALHEPFPVPPGATVTYADILTVEEARRLFPEIDPGRIVPPDRVLNLDADGLGGFADQAFDFVVISHVLEHVANPVRIVGEVFRVLRPGGRAVLAVPDMRFTFDRTRPLTSFQHLQEDYQKGVTENSDEHYLDFLRGVAPQLLAGTPAEIARDVALVRSRREHCHVWDSASFRDFLVRSLDLLGIGARPLLESMGDRNEWEYFGVWERL